LAVALVLALLAGAQWQRANKQREEALRQASVGLAAKALAELEGTVPERAVLLALEALEGYPYAPQAETALAQAVEAYTPRLVLRWGPYTWAVAWSPDGGRIAAAAEAGTVIWDADSGGQLCRIRHEEYCNGSAVAWSPDGNRLVVVGEKLAEGVDEACLAPRVWDVSKNEHLLTLTGHHGQATSVAWSPDGATILSAGVDGSARIWDADSGEELLTLAGHAGGVNDAVWSPRGDRVVTAAEDGTATVWEIPTAPALSGVEGPDTTAETGTELLTLSSHTGGLTAAAWSPDGSRIATGGTDGLVHIWQLLDGSTSSGDAVTGEILFTLSAHSKEVRGLAWSPDGERIASSSADGTVRLWDAATGEELVVLHGLLEDLRNVAWSPSGDRLIVGGGTSLPVWDVSRRRLRLSGHTDDVWDAQWSPDGRTIATTSYDGTARTWDALTGQQQLALEHPAGVRFLAWSPDGTRLVTTCQDRFARVWDAASGELLLRVSAPQDHFFFVPSWSPDGSRFAAASVPDNVIRIFDTATGELLSSFGTGDWVHRLSWSPEGDRIVVGNLGPLVWDTATGRVLEAFGHYVGLNAEWSPDGERIAFYQKGGMVKVFDAITGDEQLVFVAHADDVWHTTWSPNGMRIASGDESGEVKVWDATTGEVVLGFRAPDAVYSVNWSPDGNYIIAGGYFNPPIVRRAWQSTEDLMTYARQCCVTRELTPGEREQLGLPER
jgi:WD40 repeat protein